MHSFNNDSSTSCHSWAGIFQTNLNFYKPFVFNALTLFFEKALAHTTLPPIFTLVKKNQQSRNICFFIFFKNKQKMLTRYIHAFEMQNILKKLERTSGTVTVNYDSVLQSSWTICADGGEDPFCGCCCCSQFQSVIIRIFYFGQKKPHRYWPSCLCN